MLARFNAAAKGQPTTRKCLKESDGTPHADVRACRRCAALHSQHVRRVKFTIMHTGTSARCTTTRSNPDSAAAVSESKRAAQKQAAQKQAAHCL